MEHEQNEEYDYSKLKEAGKVSRAALEYAKAAIKPGRKFVDIAEDIEKFIESKGCKQAFPVNLSRNVEAAHYTPEYSDSRVVEPKDIIKVDLGARMDTYLTDCAVTVCLDSQYQKLVDATEKALANAVSMVKAGRKVNDIGREIAKVAAEGGFKPIRNLGGHGIEQHELHADIFIPNYDNGDNTELEEGQVIAIEPFLTTGEGFVVNGDTIQIFQGVSDRLPRSPDARRVQETITNDYLTYPFAMRWLIKGMDGEEFRVRKSIAELLQIGNLEAFPVLTERSGGIVAQAEKTLVVEKDACTVIT